METDSNKSLNRRLVSSSASVVISLSLVLFMVGLLGLVLINTQRLSNYVKENIGFTIMLKEGVNEILIPGEDRFKNMIMAEKEGLNLKEWQLEILNRLNDKHELGFNQLIG